MINDTTIMGKEHKISFIRKNNKLFGFLPLFPTSKLLVDFKNVFLCESQG